jgi:hypothetical protein
MVLPNYYLVSSYKSALCAAMECHLQVSGLFLLFALLSESPSSIAPLMLNSALLLLNSALLLLNAACLPCACAPAALPHASDLSALCQASLGYGPWPLILSQHEVILSRQHAKRRAEGALA